MNELAEGCAWCGQEIGAAKGCTVPTFSDFRDGIERTRIRYGFNTQEFGVPGTPRALTQLASMRGALPVGVDWEAVHETITNRAARVWRCHYCGVEHGSMHHPGCAVEECPCCHTQALSCECAVIDAGSRRNLPAAWALTKGEVFERLAPGDTDLSRLAQPGPGERWGYTGDGIQLDGIGPMQVRRGVPPRRLRRTTVAPDAPPSGSTRGSTRFRAAQPAEKMNLGGCRGC